MPDADPLSLFLLQRAYLLAQLRAACPAPGLYALVLDRKTQAAVLAAVPKETLLRTVTTLELLDEPRRVQKYLHAVYLVEPLVHNLSCIAADVHAARYSEGTALLVPFLQWDEHAGRMFHSARFLGHAAVARYLGGGARVAFVHALMVPVEQRVFLADTATPSALPLYYNAACVDLVLPQVRKAAKAIVNCVVAAGEYPLVRFAAAPGAAHAAARLPELIADEVQRQLDDYARLDSGFPPAAAPDKPRALLLVCDRSVDVFAPLLHEFTYQAMAMDVVEGLERRGVYAYEAEAESGERQRLETRLDLPADATWLAVRHAHILDASDRVVARIGDLIKNNPMMVDRLRAKTSADLMYVVAHLQGFDDERREATLHKSLVDECLAINAARKLAEFAADFEQVCAADGTLFDGARHRHLHDDLVALLARTDLLAHDKTRLVLLYALYRGGVARADVAKLACFVAGPDAPVAALVRRCALNLAKLGCPVVKDSVQLKPARRRTFHTIHNEGTYNTSRFSPGLKRVLAGAARYELDEDWFPYFRDKPLEDDAPAAGAGAAGAPGSLRNPRIKASWAPPSSRSSALSARRNSQRVFCFVAGGITYSEIRLVYELSDSLNRDFFLGSECILNPRGFLEGLQDIDDSKGLADLALPFDAELKWAASPAPDHLTQAPAPPPATGRRGSLDSAPVAAEHQGGSRSEGPLPQSKKLSRLKRFFK
ncbi:Sec1-like protein [Metschnikowia bicuspidata var. bicuspidata NRRL YB-4993]|uniref:Sec1-like protein n=1 Tax=Metschnikowia bicuspidata var. bicuspidata NRRL YB-4993 TaxID=869754 RepID=A0A1A0H8F0_9ASCO|nr:Sec1-like protein [Metschnikowia bicuspidata var. bicuspidata NRRL YB-4993]OBA20260.1 Sec1-like protein [Metschnikowia bicuspidata var. bicuspidata NRRL YB-4993]